MIARDRHSCGPAAQTADLNLRPQPPAAEPRDAGQRQRHSRGRREAFPLGQRQEDPITGLSGDAFEPAGASTFGCERQPQPVAKQVEAEDHGQDHGARECRRPRPVGHKHL